MPSPKGPLRGGTIQRFNQSTIQLSRPTDPHRLALISLNPYTLNSSPFPIPATEYPFQSRRDAYHFVVARRNEIGKKKNELGKRPP